MIHLFLLLLFWAVSWSGTSGTQQDFSSRVAADHPPAPPAVKGRFPSGFT